MLTPNLLDDIRVATPCRADWDKMTGDEQARFCQSCQKNVYNIAMMSRDEALALIAEKEGNLCVRLSRRADGTLITNDCPVGIKTKKRRRGWTIAAILAALIPSPLSAMLKQASAKTLRAIPAVSALEQTSAGGKVFAWLDPQPQALPITRVITMGAIAPRVSPAPGSKP
jgi:hypothetical protein